MNALANPEVGKFLNEHFVSSFQKVGTFKIVQTGAGGPAKQGGNVAAYFCAPDGRVLHVVAGPVNAATLLNEAHWVVDTTKAAIKASQGDGGTFKKLIREAHAKKLERETGLKVEALAYDAPEGMSETDALTYRDPSGTQLAPKLPPPPIDGPNVQLSEKEFNSRQNAANGMPGARMMPDKMGRKVVVNNQAVVHQILAAHGMVKIENVYGTIFENVLGEKVSTKPVEVKSAFSWVDRQGNKVR